jgi:octaprenyl-diphosphate synthase
MGTVVQLRNQINNSYFQLKDSVDEKLVLVEEKIKSKLSSDVDLVQKMTDYHIESGGKRLRALLTLGSAQLCGYTKGGRDINLAACVEMIHGATLIHDDVIDLGNIRRAKTFILNFIKNCSRRSITTAA